MQIVRVDKKNLARFADFADALYEANGNYVPYNRRELTKTLSKLLFKDRSYVGLLAIEDGTVEGRILLTVKRNDQLDTDWCGYFCMFECLFDQDVSNELLTAAENVLKGMGAMYMFGSMPAYDPQNGRNISQENFEQLPPTVTSPGKKYYRQLLTNFGLAANDDGTVYTMNFGGKQ